MPGTRHRQDTRGEGTSDPGAVGWIKIRGAREHNLQGIDLDLPRQRLIVVTGLSGSGKSSLAFDTIYAEGQRRYVESLSNYARQLLGIMRKPQVDLIEGLSPAIAIGQVQAGANPRSTVGTATEIYDFLRLLFAHVGDPHCPQCGRATSRQTSAEIVDRVLSLADGARVLLLAPLVRQGRGGQEELLARLRREGFLRIRLDGQVVELEDSLRIEPGGRHTIELVVDRVVVGADQRGRVADSVELGLEWGQGVVRVVQLPGAGGRAATGELVFSEVLACHDCGWSMEPLEPRHFSFNSPYGACPQCQGLGSELTFDVELMIPDPQRSLARGAIAPLRLGGRPLVRFYRAWLRALGARYGFDLDQAWSDLTSEQQAKILRGTGSEELEIQYRRAGRLQRTRRAWEGLLAHFERRLAQTESELTARRLRQFTVARPCRRCDGARLRRETLAVTVGGRSIADITRATAAATAGWLESLPFGGEGAVVAAPIVQELCSRLRFLDQVGVGYLALDRQTSTLSGGELQRIRLATQIGSALSGVLYVLDEPSVGLHQRDNARLLAMLRRLRDLGNTVVVVEHDEETIRAADWVVDLGPGAGVRGGRVVVSGPVAAVLAEPESLTGRYLAGRLAVPLPGRRRAPAGLWLELLGAAEHNLKAIDVRIPLGLFTCVTGVSGSGKSTLVDDILRRELARRLYRAKEPAGRFRALHGAEELDKLVVIDQGPIGRTPRSNPVTYTKAFGPIRELFAGLPASRVRGYGPGRYSFNVKGGRCESCQGDGIKRVEMHFLPDLYVPCEHCGGRRYNRETLEIRYKGRNIAEVLDLTVEEAETFFAPISTVRERLRTLREVGLGYLTLGQPATTLSGGEAQRVKLAAELSRRATGRTLYMLDEPTTGLHTHDVARLIEILQRLCDAGNTVIVIEHHPDVIKSADWVIDLGPEGGEGGGWIVAEGPPEAVAAHPGSHTGRYLAPRLAALAGPATAGENDHP